jgi:hypothetical protein
VLIWGLLERLPGEMGLHFDRIPLVKRFEALERIGSNLHVLIGSQHRTRKARSLHVLHLVNEHVTQCTDIGLEAFSSSEHDRLRVGATIGEFGEIELNALNALKLNGAQICVVAQVQGLDTVRADEGCA